MAPIVVLIVTGAEHVTGADMRLRLPAGAGSAAAFGLMRW